MARGLTLATALSTTRELPTALRQIAARMEDEVARYVASGSEPQKLILSSRMFSVRQQYLLPFGFERWAYVIWARSSCRHEMLSGAVTVEFDRRRDTLMDVYGDMGDLQSRLESAISLMVQSSEDTHDLWQKV